MNKPLGAAIGVVAIAILLKSSIFIVSEWQIGVVKRFGKVIRVEETAGLNFKIPFIEEAGYFDRRILSWDGKPSYVPTQGKYIWVDTTARWRISDVGKFISTVQNEERARSRISDILEGATKNIISRYPLVETVRSSNAIINRLKEIAANPSLAGEGADNITGEIATITIGREKLSQMIADAARKKISKMGMELIDVLIRRVAYEESVEKKVFDRMISERNRIAEKIRSVGKGERAKIEGKLDKDLKTIQSEAFKKAQGIMGEAEAEATRIYSDAFKGAPEFYEFIRTMEAYKRALPDRAKFLMSTESQFFQKIQKAN